jgi:hypothetical protein
MVNFATVIQMAAIRKFATTPYVVVHSVTRLIVKKTEMLEIQAKQLHL